MSLHNLKMVCTVKYCYNIVQFTSPCGRPVCFQFHICLLHILPRRREAAVRNKPLVGGYYCAYNEDEIVGKVRSFTQLSFSPVLKCSQAPGAEFVLLETDLDLTSQQRHCPITAGY